MWHFLPNVGSGFSKCLLYPKLGVEKKKWLATRNQNLLCKKSLLEIILFTCTSISTDGNLIDLRHSTFKKRAPKAIKVIREFARKQMNTTDVRLHPSLNGAVWARGIKSVPHRLRIRLARKRNESEDAKEKLYTLISHVPMSKFKGVQTETVEE